MVVIKHFDWPPENAFIMIIINSDYLLACIFIYLLACVFNIPPNMCDQKTMPGVSHITWVSHVISQSERDALGDWNFMTKRTTCKMQHKGKPEECPNALHIPASLITDLRALYIHKGGGRVMNSSVEWRMETEYERERERERDRLGIPKDTSPFIHPNSSVLKVL